MGCHTAQGGRPYAGGHVLATSIGTFITPNITPDPGNRYRTAGMKRTSGGRYMMARRAMAVLCTPRFHIRNIRRSRARIPMRSSPIFNRFRPFSNAIRRARSVFLSISARSFMSGAPFTSSKAFIEPEAAKSDEWNRGAYLVQGLGHCNACHTTRNPFGASQGDTIGRRTTYGLQLVRALSDFPPGGQHLRLADRRYRSIAHGRFVIPRSHNRADGGCGQPKPSVFDK